MVKLSIAATVAVATSTYLYGTNAFVPHALSRKRLAVTSLLDSVPKETNADELAATSTETELLQEIAQRNAKVDDEGKYAMADGSNTEGAFRIHGMDDGDTEAGVELSELEGKLERLQKPRAYPLFVAEKVCELLEDSLSGLTKRNETPLNGRKKERVVILGTGWGATAYLKTIDTSLYDVTVISPRNFFVFTPMLAGCSVGTVEYRSITEPVREINRKANYLEATATHIDKDKKLITCESVTCEGPDDCEIDEFAVEYDRLIVTIGAQTNTFGIPGVREHCRFLKQVQDARRIRAAIVNCFERANLPSLTEEERIQQLTFAVIGAGPSGIEFAAELRDFIEQDGPKYYPHLLKSVRIKVIEASNTVLRPFDKSLQQEAIDQLNRRVTLADPDVQNLLPEQFKLTELMLETSVKEVTEKTIKLGNGTDIPYGLAVWAAGNGPLPLTLQLVDALGKEQKAEQDTARGRLAVDPWMRVIGGEGEVLALGDCTCITKNQLPATAQVAAQQGEYLAKLMNKQYDLSPPMQDDIFLPPLRSSSQYGKSLSDVISDFATQSNEYAKPFQFLNLGILAYTGGFSALAQVTTAPNLQPMKGKGRIGYAFWKGIYLSKQVSWRNRIMIVNDWAKQRWFGRDITMFDTENPTSA